MEGKQVKSALFQLFLVLVVKCGQALVGSMLWNWFVVPLGAVSINMPTALGILCIWGAFRRPTTATTDIEISDELASKWARREISLMSFWLLVGCFLRLFM